MIKILAMILLLMPCASFANSGKDVGNGGDLCELEYWGMIPEVLAWAESRADLLTKTELAGLSSALRTVRVQCVNSKLEVGGVPKTAVTYPSLRLTKVSYERWQNADRLTRVALVLHEGLTLTGIEKTGDYHISEQLQFPQNNRLRQFSCKLPGKRLAWIELVRSQLEKSEHDQLWSYPMYRIQLRFPDLDGTVQILNDHLQCFTQPQVSENIILCTDYLFDHFSSVAKNPMPLVPIFKTSQEIAEPLGFLSLKIWIAATSDESRQFLSDASFHIDRGGAEAGVAVNLDPRSCQVSR